MKLCDSLEFLHMDFRLREIPSLQTLSYTKKLCCCIFQADPPSGNFRVLDEWCPIRTVIVCNVIFVGQNSSDADSDRSNGLYRLLIFPITIVCRDQRSRRQLPDQESRSRQL